MHSARRRPQSRNYLIIARTAHNDSSDEFGIFTVASRRTLALKKGRSLRGFGCRSHDDLDCYNYSRREQYPNELTLGPQCSGKRLALTAEATAGDLRQGMTEIDRYMLLLLYVRLCRRLQYGARRNALESQWSVRE